MLSDDAVSTAIYIDCHRFAHLDIVLNITKRFQFSWKLLPVMVVFLGVTVISLFLTYLTLSVQSTARAFVTGEALWSKAQKDAVFYLDRYAESGDPRHLKDFEEVLVVSRGIRRARLELQKPRYDPEIVRQGFLEGGNHPDDIPGAVRLLRCCASSPFLARTLELWAQGDDHMLALEALAEELRAEFSAGSPSETRIAELREEIYALDRALRPLTEAFSNTIGEATRWLQRTLLILTTGIIIGLIALGIFASSRILNRIWQSERKYQALLDTANDALVIVDQQSGIVLESNRRAEQMTGLPTHRINGSKYLDLYPPAQQAAAQPTSMGVEGHQGRDVSRLDIRHEDGHLIPAEVSVSTTVWEGRPVVLAIIRDITERMRAEEDLRVAANALANIAEGVMITDAGKYIVSVNRAFTAISGYQPHEITGKHLTYLQSDRHPPAFYANLWDTIEATGNWQGEIWSRRRDGEVYPSWTSVGAVFDEHNNVKHYVAVFNDISQYKNYEQRLEYLAHHDSLTQLPNRIFFEGRVRDALRRAREHNAMVGLLFIDLDGFKAVNDRYGHSAGDELLAAVAKRIRSCVRQRDEVARVGGDEFTVLLDELVDLKDAALVAQKLLDAISRPVTYIGNELSVLASIGVSCYPRDGEDVQTLLSNADAAMYEAKQESRNAYKLFSPRMKAKASAKLELANALQRAHQRQEFSLVYQPCIDLTTGEFTSVEALIRWLHPERGNISPAAFIPLAEEIGLIKPITEWVLYTACRQATAWNRQGLPPLRMAVNISARHFRDRDLAHSLSTILQATGWEAHWLNLEITEGVVMKNDEEVERILAELHDMGIGIAVDDFGTGYSSLSYLKNFLIDYLKIDRSFISGIPSNPNDVTIAKSIIAMANNLNIRIIAEGIETEQQLGFLRAQGCHEGQGYLFSKPLPAAEVELLLRRSLGHIMTKPVPRLRAAEP